MFFNNSNFRENDLDDVLTACMANNPKAQRVLIKQFYAYAMKICLPYAASKMEAEELLNDGFLKVLTNLQKYNSTNNFKAWLRAIMVNTAIDYYRRNQKYKNNLDIATLEIGDDSNEDIISKISAEEIIELIQEIPPSYRIVFTMYVVEGYNHREIAEKLQIKEGTSKSNLAAARVKLQALIRINYPHLFEIYANERQAAKNILNEN